MTPNPTDTLLYYRSVLWWRIGEAEAARLSSRVRNGRNKNGDEEDTFFLSIDVRVILNGFTIRF